MTTKSHRTKSRIGPAKKQNEVSTSRPVDTIANRVKTLRSAASALEHGRHSTAQKKLAQIASDEFTPRQTDAIIAALRLLQQPNVDPEWVDDLASQHGDPLNEKEIDILVEQINTPVDKPADKPEDSPLCRSDKELDVLDVALNTAEDVLTPLLRFHKADEVKRAFAQHVSIHLGEELANIEAHGHRNDDPEDKPKTTVYSDLLSLAELIEAGNTEFDALERRAADVLKKARKLR